jgi:LmbE family N-acetylglucosaminyl deacetylase
MLSNYTTALTFFAHPDDETLAAGATMRRLTREGCRVFVAIPHTGIRSRRNRQPNGQEQLLVKLRSDCFTALAVLGIREEDIYLGEFSDLGYFSDNESDRHTLLELIHWLENILDRLKPDVIFTHHRFCTNIDHQYCHEAAVVAARPSVQSHIPVFCGEVPSSTGYLRPAQWEPNLYVDVTADDLAAKVNAMESYETEARPDPHPRSPEVLRALAKVRGAEAGFHFAEAFMVQKIYV